MRVAVVGAGVGGLACAVRLAHAGHRVTVLEAGPAPGGKAARVERDGFRWDAGPSLVTMPHVLGDLFRATGRPLEDELELVRVEPVTRYRFADGSSVELSADVPRAVAALERWSPGAGDDWMAFLGTCAAMWRASAPVLEGPAPWPPSRPRPGDPRPSPSSLVRVRPWWTLRQLARAHARDPRLRMVIERFATYAGADPRRAPAALALAGYVEHAFGAWHPRGGVHEIVLALARRLEALGGELRLGTPVRRVLRRDRRARGVLTDDGVVPADAVVLNVDAERALGPLLGRPPRRPRERSLSGLVTLLGLRGATPGLVHHEIRFPADYDAEFDDVFAGRPPREPTIYVSASCATDPGAAPPGHENWFVLVNAPAAGDAADWGAVADAAIARLGVADRVVVRAARTPGDLDRESGAAGGAIYGAAPHGRLGTLRRPGNRVRGLRGAWLVGGTVHPGGGLPLVMLGAATVARAVGPAR
ncbi:phytoene desaturase family protein [Miltoncostaea marina]|uniref:phytoene desaturase family protein n=1 Tax=Miltoncostaea marina TaxID=2843215 RepID=UPI001C3E657E|nr:phytoene desaturase family protein [Miltoncostaea marina]